MQRRSLTDALHTGHLIDLFVKGTAILSASFICLVMLALIYHLTSNGIERISWEFFVTEPRMAGRLKGIAPIIVSTLLILGVALAASLPLGIASALALAEYTPSNAWTGRVIRRSLDILAGTPSIVFGLFGNAFFSHILGLGFSILSGGLTLACMMLPLLVRTSEEGFRAVPREYRNGALALGYSKQRMIWHILIPAAAPAITVGVILSMGRALAETAALIFTSGYVDRMPNSLMDSGRSLSIHIYDLSMNVPGGDASAYASALTLVAMLLIINGIALALAKRIRL